MERLRKTPGRVAYWVGELATWIHLKDLGKNKLVKMAALFPVVGYMILFNKEINSRLDLYFDIPGDYNFPILTSEIRLYLFFFGSCCMALFLLSLIFMPRAIKFYDSFHDYENKRLSLDVQQIHEEVNSCMKDVKKYRKSHLSSRILSRRLKMKISRSNNFYDVVRSKAFDEFGDQLANFDQASDAIQKYREASKVVVRLRFWLIAREYICIRIVSYIFFIIGVLIIFAPSIDVFLAVVEQLIKKM